MMNDAKVLILGLGEIGYSNAEYMSQHSLNVYGYDVEKRAIKRAIHDGVIKEEATSFMGFDYYIVCISTHDIANMNMPSFKGLFEIARRLYDEGAEGALVSIESTVTKGTCNKVSKILDHKLHLVHFPHRFYAKEKDVHGVRQLRVLGGYKKCCTNKAVKFYEDSLDIPLHIVSSIEIAELSKIVENSYRFLEIAFSEELRMFCDAYQIDYHQLKEAINSKWNVNLLEAKEGIGGHCLPKDTEMYLKLLNRVSDESIIRSAKEVENRYRFEINHKDKLEKPIPFNQLQKNV